MIDANPCAVNNDGDDSRARTAFPQNADEHAPPTQGNTDPQDSPPGPEKRATELAPQTIRHRVSNQALQLRVTAVRKAILLGAQLHELYELADDEGWNVSQSTVRDYQRKAFRAIQANTEATQPWRLAAILGKLDTVFSRALDIMDLPTALKCQQAIHAICYPASTNNLHLHNHAPAIPGQAHEKACQYSDEELVAEIQERKLEREKNRLSDRNETIPQVVVREGVNAESQTAA